MKNKDMNDLISRQAAIDAFEKYKVKLPIYSPRETDVLWNGAIECCVMEVEDLPSAQQWIPVDEKLPFAEYGEGDTVLTTCKYKDAVPWCRKIVTLYWDGGNWKYPTGELFEGEVTAWMPVIPYYDDMDVDVKAISGDKNG